MQAEGEQNKHGCAIFGHAVTVIIIFFVVSFLGKVWAFLGLVGAVIMGGMAVLSALMNLSVIVTVFSESDELKRENSSAWEFLPLLIMKLGVDCLAGYLAVVLWQSH